MSISIISYLNKRILFKKKINSQGLFHYHLCNIIVQDRSEIHGPQLKHRMNRNTLKPYLNIYFIY